MNPPPHLTIAVSGRMDWQVSSGWNTSIDLFKTHNIAGFSDPEPPCVPDFDSDARSVSIHVNFFWNIDANK